MLAWIGRRHPAVLKEPTIAAQALTAMVVTTLDLVFYSRGLEGTSLGQVLSTPLEVAWAIVAWLGGFLTLKALLWPRRGDDAMAGLALLGSTFIVDAVAVFVYRGPGPGSITGSVLAALGLSFIARGSLLHYERQKKMEALNEVVAFMREEAADQHRAP